MKQKVTMVTVTARDLKSAFRKTFPDKTAAELKPVWDRFWACMVLAARVEKVEAEEEDVTKFPDPQPITVNSEEKP
jgi:hypothetical protein